MKQLTFLTKFFVLFLAISFWSSCEDGTGGGGGGITVPPTIELKSGTGLTTTNETLSPNGVFTVNVEALNQDNDLTTFTILEDGIALDAGRINYVGIGSLSNPYTLSSSEAITFNTNIEVTAHDSGTRTYTFRIADSAGETDEVSIEITIFSGPLMLGFESANGGVSANSTFDQQTFFKVELNASKGASPLSTLTVLENGVAITDLTRIRFGIENDFGMATEFFTNPLDLVNDEKDGFNWFVWVNSHAGGTANYTFQIEAEDAETASLDLDITINNLTELTGKLLNNNAGANPGSMNVLTGEAVLMSSTESHIRDQGIDLSMPNDQNWSQQIAPVNGASIRTPAADFPTFGSVNSASEILNGWDNGTTVGITSALTIGSQFFVMTPTGEIVLIEVTDIVATANDNLDYYDLSIKY